MTGPGLRFQKKARRPPAVPAENATRQKGIKFRKLMIPSEYGKKHGMCQLSFRNYKAFFSLRHYRGSAVSLAGSKLRMALRNPGR